MSMVVQHNMQAMNSNRMLGITTSAQASSTEKLSSGYKINRAADDAAGLTISEKMRKQIRGLDRASTNAEDGVSAVQTAEGALTEVHSMLQRMNELATQAANGTNSESDRQAIQDEISQLTTEIDRVAETTKFNEIYLLKGASGTKEETLVGHDAGITGTFVDGPTTASLTVDLSVGTEIMIAGVTYNIAEEDSGSTDASDSIETIQGLVEQMDNSDYKDNVVTLDGTQYTLTEVDSGEKDEDGNPINNYVFDAGTGVTYTAEELAAKIDDGTTVSITKAGTDGAEAVTFTGEDESGNETSTTVENVIARDYTDNKNISASEAAKLIETALIQANNVGATKDAATVAQEEKTDTTGQVATLTNNPDATATANTAAMIYDKTEGVLIAVSSGDDITEYATDESGRYSFYSLVKDNSAGSAAVTLGDSALSGVTSATGGLLTSAMLVHEDGEVDGAKLMNTTALASLPSSGGLTSGGLQIGYSLYKAVDVTEIADIKNATIKASGTLTNSTAVTTDATTGISISFEDIDTNDAAKAETQVNGQNALIDAIEAGAVNFTYAKTTDTTNAVEGKFSHGDLSSYGDESLDITEDGTVTYGGEEIAKFTLGVGAVANYTAGTTAKVAFDSNEDAQFATLEGDVSTDYTFTITKGTTEVAKDLAFDLHVGADADMTNKIAVNIEAMTAAGLGIANLNVADDTGIAATYAIDAIADAIAEVSSQRSALGAVQNRLEHTINNLDNVVENTTSAESRIRDTDMAEEMVEYSKNNILAQAGQAMLAQANTSTQGVLSLLG